MIVSEDAAARISRYSEMYGHAEILRRFVGVEDRRLRLVGQLQHGWSVGACVDPEPQPLYVWNDRSLVGLGAAGYTGKVRAIGAPYLYLPPAPTRAELGRTPRSLLAFPEHSTPGYPYADAYDYWGRYAAWLDEVRREADLEQTTVCLHCNDYDDPVVCHILLRHGHVVACCGLPSSARTTFLDRLRAYVRRHGMVTANAVGSAVFYAAYEGAPVFVGGPVPTRAAAAPNVTEVWHPEVHEPDWIDREFPGLRVPPRMAMPQTGMAARELGTDYVCDRAALWDTLTFALVPE